MAASSSLATPQLKNYDVFLSFRGEDTRYNFTKYLYWALHRKAIETFIDDQLKKGDEISPSLLDTIKASKISVIIFSENYASSGWCLQELEQILDCKKKKQQIIIPIFYNVEPSHVRNQIESFGKGFAELQERLKEKPEMLQRWKSALNEAANLSGWTIDAKTSEPELIDEIVDDILKTLNKLSPSYYEGLVGVEFSIGKIESLLHRGSNGVSKIGILGIGGIGKTTIAEVVFKKISSQFEGSYFAENVREVAEKSSTLIHLKKELLSKILDDRDPDIRGNFIEERLKRRKVLIVFDDLTSLQQIEDLIGNLNWLSSESQIIITTRDKHVLKSCGVDDAYIHKVKELGEKEAHQLFNQYAFRQYSPTADYVELSKKTVAYTKCVPLALKVLGSYLFSREKDFWESAIKKLEKFPHSDIDKVLKVSYDGLDKEEKDIFLDIACFFKGEHIELVIDNLNACRLSTKQGIQVLIDKCLVFVTYNKIIMHDLLQEMGKEIARGDTCKEIRLCHCEDISEAFEEDMEIEAVWIRSINLDISKISNGSLDCRVLSKMPNLRFFRVYNSQDHHENKLKGFPYLQSFSNRLTFFSWKGYPFESVPKHFPSKSIIRLDMQHNNVKHWNGFQDLVNLKYVDLSYSEHMTEIPNLSKASNIQELILAGCTSLLEIAYSSSIQNLNKLVKLDLSFCRRLISLPDYIQSKSIDLGSCKDLKIAPKISCKVEELDLWDTAIEESPFVEHPSSLVKLNLSGCSWLESLSSNICKLKFLKMLSLVYCPKLERLPDDFGDLEALEFLHTEGTIIKEVPSSILHLPKLYSLSLSQYINEAAPLNWVLNCSSGSNSLKDLSLVNCQITKLPDNLGQLSFLETLNLSGNNFESIPENIKEFSNLHSLVISNCQRLQHLPELPMGVTVEASNCLSLQSISNPSFLLSPHWRSRTTTFANCFELDLTKILHEESCREFCANICFPGNEIPKWFTFQNTGSYITLVQSLDWHNENFLGFLISAVVNSKELGWVSCNYNVTFYFLVKSKDGKEQIYRNTASWNNFSYEPDHMRSDHVLLFFHSIAESAFEECKYCEYHEISSEMKSLNCKVLIIFHCGRMEVKKCGIHFLYVEDYGKPLETSRRIVDNAKKKGKEKEKDELQSNKLQISNSFDGICSLRPRFMSTFPHHLECLEARYWKLKRNALKEIAKNALLNFQQSTILCSDVEEFSLLSYKVNSYFYFLLNNKFDVKLTMLDFLLQMNCVNPKGCMSFPGSEIPEWFDFQNASYYIALPRDKFQHEFADLAFCTVVEFPDLLDLGQPFLVNCELLSKEVDGSYKVVAIGLIKGWFEGDITHYMKSDHVFLGYDCYVYG